MGKLNVANPNRTRGVIRSETTSTATTFQGAPGFKRDLQGELFLLAVTNFVGEDTFYEKAANRDSRYVELVRAAAVAHPQWTAELLQWLRGEANMRTASIVGAVEAGKALSGSASVYAAHLKAGGASARKILNAVLLRADEPGEALAYWLNNYGRKLPKWLNRGLGDAAVRLYNPWTVGKWDSDRAAVRFADVIELSQTKQAAGDSTGLFKYLLDDRHGRANADEAPGMVRLRRAFNQIPMQQRRGMLTDPEFGHVLVEAGLTWEAISGWINGPMDAQAWQIAIPLMAYGALIKNLRNFDEAGIDNRTREIVRARLIDPYAVAKSRLLPMAFLNAYNNMVSDYWKPVLDEAATCALLALPALPGKTLILIDTSGSMNVRFSKNPYQRSAPGVEALNRWDVAALFGIALGRVAHDATVVSFSDAGWQYSWSSQADARRPHNINGSKAFDLRSGENLLAAVSRFRKTHFIGGGTATKAAVDRWFKGHDRVVVLTDEQAAGHTANHVFAGVPEKIPTYTFNLAGYSLGHAPSVGNRFTVGGLSDAGFRMITALEARQRGQWPWHVTSTCEGR